MKRDKKTIILAEDEKILGSTLTFLLKKNGYDVNYFTDGFSAYKKIKELVESEHVPDLVITDLQMPGLKGMELIDYINSLAFHLPILVITGYGDKTTVINLLRKGCMEYIDKPFDDKTFLKSVQNIFNKEQKRNLELVDIKIKLLQELDQYKKENHDFQIQINAAIESYQNLINSKKIPEELPLVYHAMPFCHLGGDFFDIRKTRAGYDVLFADVAGHDISACFNTVVIKGSFYEHREIDGMGDAYFKILNEQLVNNFPEGRLVTAVFLTINLNDMVADFTIAGHPLPFITFRNTIIQLSVKNPVLGFLKGIQFTKERIELRQGMRILLYTDGIINAWQYTDEEVRYLGNSGFRKYITQYYEKPLLDMVDGLWADTLTFCHQKPCDDMLLLGIEVP